MTLLLAIAGCGPILQHGTPLTDVLAEEAAEQGRSYALQPGDQVEVHHILDPDYSAVLTVAPDGTINVPGLKHPVAASGSTLPGLQDALNRAYQADDVLAKPFFSVNLRAFGSLEVFVGGEVQKPGFLELSGGERRVLQVIASSGGFLPTARVDEVIILRTRRDGGQTIFSVDLSRVLTGQDLRQNVRIQPLDTVLVPRSDVASLDLWIDQHIRQALPVNSGASVTYTNNPALGK